MDRTAPRISDVARTAGVSTATVSRALSSPDLVSEGTRKIVLEAIEATGYRVNHAARNLRRQQTGGIVVLVPYLSNPFFSQILSGIAAVASQAGFNLLIADTRQPQGADAQIADYLHNNRADGLIVLDGMLSQETLIGNGRGRGRPPVVFACEWIDGVARPSVTIDNREAAALAVRHLVSLGHRRIGHVMGPARNVLTIARRQGALDALAEAGLVIRDDWFFDGDFSLPSGVVAARHFLALAERPSAVFCSSDEMAFGFMSELHHNGVSVPQDVSVVGFDDIEIAKRFIPALTTVHQPRTEIGETAARMLLALIDRSKDGNEGLADRAKRLPVELVIRDSTCPPGRR